MKRFFTILLAVALSITLTAQNSNRTADTKIIDALNQLPAENQELYNRIIGDIVSTGDEGLWMLLDMLKKNDASTVAVQYAISGLVSASTSADFDSQRRESIIAALEAALVSASDETVKGFLTRELMILGVPAAKVEPVPVLPPKEALKALKAATVPSERCAALNGYIESAGIAAGEKIILKAIKDPCREYRFAALYAVSRYNGSFLYEKIGALLPKLKSDDARVDVIWWFGEERAPQNASFIKPYLSSENFELVSAAAEALTCIGCPETMGDVAALLSGKDSKRIALAEGCLKTYNGDVCRVAVPLFTAASPEGKAAIINIIASRRNTAYKKLVFDNLNSSETAVEDASFAALKAISSEEDLPMLYSLLEETEYTPCLQAAINEALSSKERGERYEILVSRREKAPAGKEDLYIPMIVASASLEQLFQICAEENSEQAFTALLNTISTSGAPGAQRLLLLRRAMETAADSQQKVSVLNLVAKTDTFIGLIYAGSFIEDASLQQAAAQAVRKLAIGNKSFHGPEVTALLNRAAEVITGPDAQYEITGIRTHLESLPEEEGFVSMFNGKDLSGWQGLTTTYKKKQGLDNPFARARLTPKELAGAQAAADELMAKTWKVEDGHIVFFGTGYDNLCSVKKYGDFEMYLDWYLYPEGPEADAGIYLRGTPQVQIWDTARVNVGAQVGSGGLYNNQVNPSKPLCVADNGLGLWNSFYIKMTGERVSVWLNGILVTDNVILENYWDRSQPIFPIEQIELQAHGSKVAYRDLYIRELPRTEPVTLSKEEAAEGFEMLFDGTTLNKWIGNKHDYVTENGVLAVHPSEQGFGDLYTAKEYDNFIFRFEFKLTPGANNGVGIRAPGTGDAAYEGMEIQILDHYDAIYQPLLRDYQYHGSVYGIIPAQNRDALMPVGEWNTEEIYANGSHIRVTLNGVVITEGDIREATADGTYDGKEHPGLFRPSGHIGFLGHGSELWFRNIRIKEIK